MGLNKMDAIILVGGKGTRLAQLISDIPKPMAKLDDGRPFVDVIVARLKVQNIGRIIMATGHLANHIHEYYKDDSRVLCVKEDVPLGTGGAVRFVMEEVKDLSDPFFVLNGDSFYPFDLNGFLKTDSAMLGAVNMDSAARYGTLSCDDKSNITGFMEKTGIEEAGLVNAGVYKLYHSDLRSLPIKKCSLEQDIFPELVSQKRLKYVHNDGPMLDIGLPETYALASEFIKDLGA